MLSNFCAFETGSFAARPSFEFLLLLPLLAKCWDYRYMPSHLITLFTFKNVFIFQLELVNSPSLLSCMYYFTVIFVNLLPFSLICYF